uniref:Aldehyde dehydrogenase domain-containing protein n=1 Tax=Strigamia maritima TaxID=126957 RepID=T1JMV3_STRMM
MGQLQRLKAMLEDNQNLFVEALKKDLSKPYMECVIMEVGFMVNDILNTIYNLKDWMKPEKVEKPWYAFTDKAYISRDPLGVAVILSAWNYPVQLLISPLVGAIASGNCAVVKPSEISPATAQLLADLIPRYLDKECYPVVLGGAAETTELLKNKFDHIFYTGSVRVGRIIYETAAKQFTPVTLELGGKCPTYIDDTVRYDYAAKRIMWGKLINSGQTCVAPDYVMCTKAVEEKFLTNVSKYLREWYGDDPKSRPIWLVLLTKACLIKLLGNGTIAIGGEYDPEELYIAPTVLTNIFGPILPIITIDSLDEAVEFVNSRYVL